MLWTKSYEDFVAITSSLTWSSYRNSCSLMFGLLCSSFEWFTVVMARPSLQLTRPTLSYSKLELSLSISVL